MKYMLDTNTASDVMVRVPAVEARLRSLRGSLCLSWVTVVELTTGAHAAPTTAARNDYLRKVDALTAYIKPVVPTMADIAAVAGLRARLHGLGLPAGDLDELIAGHALAITATLVTRDRKLARKLKKLADIGVMCEDWSDG